MRHCGTQTIETERLTLRRLLSADADQMYENWASDPAVTKYLRWDPHPNAAHTAELLRAWETLYPNDDYYQWCCVEKATGAVFGTISLFLDEEGWECGYCFGQRWWGKGYATEAARAVVRYWFDTVGADELSCCHALGNPASGRVMQKAGFVYDHDAVYHKFDGTPVSCRCFLLTRERYEALYHCEQ